MQRSWQPEPAGFTLVELVMVIALTGVVAMATARFIAEPVRGYLDVQRRADLVDIADTALGRMGRELRLALPNSVRTSSAGTAVEMVRIRTGGRYRTEGSDPLDFTAASDTFDVIGTLPDAADVVFDPAAIPGDCVSGDTDCLVIYNTGQNGADAYAGDSVAALQAASATAITFTRAAPFSLSSPGARFYVTQGPVTFFCDPVGGTVRRYTGYPLTPNQSDVDTAAELVAAGASADLLVNRVTECRFDYQAGTATRGGLVTLRLAVSRDGEGVSLLQQVHVANLP